MSIAFTPLTKEQLLRRHDGDKIIAQPGEPVVTIDAGDARRKVNRYIGEEVSLMMYGLEPALILSEGRLVWRIPIVLATPTDGHIGLIGALDVDARNSNLILPPNFAEEIEANARALLKSSLRSTEG